jgi:hypothetical protein
MRTPQKCGGLQIPDAEKPVKQRFGKQRFPVTLYINRVTRPVTKIEFGSHPQPNITGSTGVTGSTDTSEYGGRLRPDNRFGIAAETRHRLTLTTDKGSRKKSSFLVSPKVPK